jgi:hypothetical protein
VWKVDSSLLANPPEHAPAAHRVNGRCARARSDTIQIAIDTSQEEELLRRYRWWFWAILLASSNSSPVHIPGFNCRVTSEAADVSALSVRFR